MQELIVPTPPCTTAPLATAIEAHPSLVSLSLACDPRRAHSTGGVGLQEVELLTEVLPSTNVESLSLAFNRVGDDGLATLLQGIAQISSLDLENAGINEVRRVEWCAGGLPPVTGPPPTLSFTGAALWQTNFATRLEPRSSQRLLQLTRPSLAPSTFQTTMLVGRRKHWLRRLKLRAPSRLLGTKAQR